MIYQTISGKHLDVDALQRDERQLVQRAYRLYCLNVRYEEYNLQVYAADGNSTAKDELSKATRHVLDDLKQRLGVRQGRLKHDWDGPIDPAWNLSAATGS